MKSRTLQILVFALAQTAILPELLWGWTNAWPWLLHQLQFAALFALALVLLALVLSVVVMAAIIVLDGSDARWSARQLSAFSGRQKP